MNVDAYFLEYDDARSGDFKPLRFLPKGKTVVLGPGDDQARRSWRTKDDLKRRIDEAAKYAPLDQLCLSPQCGFSSTVHGNNIAVEAQRAKLRLVVETAAEVWKPEPACSLPPPCAAWLAYHRTVQRRCAQPFASPLETSHENPTRLPGAVPHGLVARAGAGGDAEVPPHLEHRRPWPR